MLSFTVLLDFCVNISLFFLTDAGTIFAYNCTNGRISLSCPDCAIELVRALYGHPVRDRGVCKTSDTDCVSGVTSEVKKQCHMKRKCDIIVAQQRNTNVCDHVSSYLQVEYQCRCGEVKSSIQIFWL